MATSSTRGWLLAAASLLAVGLSGCSGSDGAAGATGATGPQGVAGKDLAATVVDAQKLTFDDLKNRALGGKIISVDTSANQPVVKFQVYMADSKEPLVGLATFSLHLAQLKPAANGSPSYWQNYIADGLPVSAMPATTSTAITNPGSDAVSTFNTDGTLKAQGYKVVDNRDGTYTVTFGANIKANTKVPYDASLTHRVVVGVRSVAVPGVVGKTPGAYAGVLNPLTGATFAQFVNTSGVNLIADFKPSASGAGTIQVDANGAQTFARDNVTVEACNQCHYKIQYGFPRGNNTSGHFGSRTDTKTCVMCHTPQNAVSTAYPGGAFDFTPFIHKIHMGEELPAAETGHPFGLFEAAYPQDQRNCVMCHKGAVTDNYKQASRKACGACHNDINFATGANHAGHAQADDTKCALCHDAASIPVDHLRVNAVPNAYVSTVQVPYANNNALPTGAYKITYAIKSVSVDASRKVSVQFQVLKDGTAVNFGTYNASTNANLIPNTTGGPSLYIAYNVPQDGIASPADFNARMSVALGVGNPTVTSAGVFTPAATTSSLWAQGGTLTASGITWTLSVDSSNVYTVTSSLPLPATTTMVRAALIGTFTQTNLAAYPFKAASAADYASYLNTSGATAYTLKTPGIILAPAVVKADVTSTGFTARRTLVDNAKCLACHEQLGVKPAFHGAARNDGTICNFCHTPNGVNAGWSYSFNTFVHGIHGGALRTTPYTFAEDWSAVGYPGLLKNCEQCHVSGSYDFSGTANAAAVPNLLFNTVGTGTTAAAGVTTSPYIAQTAGTVYGSGFAYATTTGSVVTTEAASTTLVTSPITASCSSCHDSNTAIAHFKLNGGSFYEARATALAKKETCLVCHGPANNAAFNETVPAIKTVHRWW